ncbi:hypothetical protein [Halorussus marinus]|nr:hypothetical protein [Halorussus marinus]
MIQEFLNSTEAPGKASWTSDKMLAFIAVLVTSAMMFFVGLAVLAPEAVKTIGFAVLGIGGSILSVIAVIVLLYNFNKILKETGFR